MTLAETIANILQTTADLGPTAAHHLIIYTRVEAALALALTATLAAITPRLIRFIHDAWDSVEDGKQIIAVLLGAIFAVLAITLITFLPANIAAVIAPEGYLLSTLLSNR